jgi:hypothetical protein
MHTTLRHLTTEAAFTSLAGSVSAQTARDIRGPSPLVAIEIEPRHPCFLSCRSPSSRSLRAS